MADDRELAEIWRNQYTGPLFRKYRGTEEVPEASIGYLARQSRLAVDFCQKMMAPLGLKHYAVNTPLNLPSGEIGVMHTNVIAGFGGTPIVTTRVELSRKRRKEEERELPGLFVWSKEVEIDGETVLKGYCLEPNPAIRVDGTLLGEEGTWRLFELKEVPESTIGYIHYTFPTNYGVTTLTSPDPEDWTICKLFGEGSELLGTFDDTYRDGLNFAYTAEGLTEVGFLLWDYPNSYDLDGTLVELGPGDFLFQRTDIINDSALGPYRTDTFSFTPEDNIKSTVEQLTETYVLVRNYYSFPLTYNQETIYAGNAWSGGEYKTTFTQEWRYIESPQNLGFYYEGYFSVEGYAVGDSWDKSWCRVPENGYGNDYYDYLRDRGKAQKKEEILTGNREQTRTLVHAPLGLINLYEGSSSITTIKYDEAGYESERISQNSGRPTSYETEWNGNIIEMRSGYITCYTGEECIFRTYFLIDLSFCTVDGAAVIMQIERLEYYDQVPYHEEYFVKYLGFYDNQVIELTDLFESTNAVSPFQLRLYEWGDERYEVPFIHDKPVGNLPSNYIYYMALQRPKAKP